MRKRSLPQPEERTERRISAATSLSICALTVIAQIVLTLALTQLLAEKISYVYFILELAGAVVAIWVYLRPGSPSYKLVWMCLLLALPVAGMILFLLWGGSHQAKSLSLRKVAPPVERESARQASAANVAHLSRRSPAWGRLASYLQSRDFLLYGGSQARYFAEGADFFDDLVLHLQRAEIYIFLEYYILAEGQIWDRIFHVLRERAAAGVEVRIIFDDFGNLTRFSDASLQALQDAGVEVEVFNPVHRYVNRIYFNYRDHRKIAVIDGVHAYTGGINLADEYINAITRFGYWKDAGLRIEGAAVWNFTVMFLDFWNAFRPFEQDYSTFRPQLAVLPASDGVVQPYADSPLDEEPVAETVYLDILAQSQQYVYFYTPYLAIGEEMLDALRNAAKRGVDVRLVLPGIPDKKLVFRLSRSYYLPLLRAGVRIYEYTPGFLHAKCCVSDDRAAVVGSINMDYRSMFLHFECGVLLLQNSQVLALRDDVRRTLYQCREVQCADCRTGLVGTVLDSVLRLLSPLM